MEIFLRLYSIMLHLLWYMSLFLKTGVAWYGNCKLMEVTELYTHVICCARVCQGMTLSDFLWSFALIPCPVGRWRAIPYQTILIRGLVGVELVENGHEYNVYMQWLSALMSGKCHCRTWQLCIVGRNPGHRKSTSIGFWPIRSVH